MMRDYKKVEEILRELLEAINVVMDKYPGNEVESALGILGMSCVQQLPVSDIPEEHLDEHFKLMCRLQKGDFENEI